MEEIVVAKKIVAGKEIEYSLILSDFAAGVKISENNDDFLSCILPDRCDNVLRLVRKLAEGNVTLVNVSDILEDYMYELSEKY